MQLLKKRTLLLDEGVDMEPVANAAGELRVAKVQTALRAHTTRG